MGRVLAQLFAITEQFDMVTQPQLLLLQKTMVTVEGVARSFDPKVNIWDASEKLVGDWLRKSIGPQAILQDMADNAGRTLRMVQRCPIHWTNWNAARALCKTINHPNRQRAATASPALSVSRLWGWHWRQLSIGFCKKYLFTLFIGKLNSELGFKTLM